MRLHGKYGLVGKDIVNESDAGGRNDRVRPRQVHTNDAPTTHTKIYTERGST